MRPLPLPPCALAPAGLQSRALKQLATGVFVTHVQIDGSLLSLPLPLPSPDPNVQVEYASIAGQTSNIQAQQDEYGFHIVPGAGLLSTIPADGEQLAVWGPWAGRGPGSFRNTQSNVERELRCLPVQLRSYLQATP